MPCNCSLTRRSIAFEALQQKFMQSLALRSVQIHSRRQVPNTVREHNKSQISLSIVEVCQTSASLKLRRLCQERCRTCTPTERVMCRQQTGNAGLHLRTTLHLPPPRLRLQQLRLLGDHKAVISKRSRVTGGISPDRLEQAKATFSSSAFTCIFILELITAADDAITDEGNNASSRP